MSKGIYIDFRKHAPVQVIAAGTAATGADTSVNYMQFGEHSLEMYYETASAAIGCTRDAAGLILPVDDLANDGVEMSPGIVADANLPGRFKIGTDAAFEGWLECAVPDATDWDVACFGFRKCAAYADVAAHAATITAYSDVALLNLNVDTGVFTGTRLNSGTGTLTDTTVNHADATIIKLGVKVSAAGVATFYIDDTVTAVDTVTFDSTDIVTPFWHFTKAATNTATAPTIKRFYCGLQ